MKTKYLLLSTVLLIASCSKPTDKKAELASLKTQQKELEGKIKVLEKELGAGSEGKKENEKIIAVTVTPLASQNFKHFVEVQGVVEAENTINVGPQTGGAITSLLVKVGDPVSKGQLIATIDNSILKESLEEIKQQLSLATTLYEKQKSLWDQQIGTEVQFLTAKSNKESLERRIATMKAQLALTRVTAPIAGTVEIVRLKEGEMATPGMGIIQLVNLGKLKITSKVADTYLGSVKKGDNLVIKFPDINKELDANISVVSKTVNAVTRTFDVEARIPNASGLLKPNQLAVLKINDQSKNSAIVINQNIIQKTESGDIVYVAGEEAGKKVAKARKVKTGLSYNGQIEILEGLSTGDQIITEGFQELVDGQAISF